MFLCATVLNYNRGTAPGHVEEMLQGGALLLLLKCVWVVDWGYCSHWNLFALKSLLGRSWRDNPHPTSATVIFILSLSLPPPLSLAPSRVLHALLNLNKRRASWVSERWGQIKWNVIRTINTHLAPLIVFQPLSAGWDPTVSDSRKVKKEAF